MSYGIWGALSGSMRKNVLLLSKVREGFHYEHNALELFSAIPCKAG